MCFLSHLPPAIGDFLRAGAGSSKYEHALLCSLAAIVCILALIVLV